MKSTQQNINNDRRGFVRVWRLVAIAVLIFAPLTSQASVADYFQDNFSLSLENIYWGEFHGHSSYSADAVTASETFNVLNAAEAYAYARDVQNLDFVALSDHADMVNRTEMPFWDRLRGISMWESLYYTGLRYNDEDASDGDAFIVFQGYEYTNTYGFQPAMGSSAGYGHKNVIFKKFENSHHGYRLGASRFNIGIPIFAFPDYAETVYDLYSVLWPFRPSSAGEEGGCVAIVHTPANTGTADTLDEVGGLEDHRTDWDALDGDFTRNVEIFSKWGNSEGPTPQSLNAICPNDHVYGYAPSVPGVPDPITIRNTIYERWVIEGDDRFILSFLGGTDGHSGRPACYDYSGVMNYEGAVTGLIAPQLSRDDLWSALWNRQTLACTTSRNMKRAPLLFAVETNGSDLLMGEAGFHDGTARVRVLADPDVYEIDLIVDGCLENTWAGNTLDTTVNIGGGRHFIYVRARWTDNGVAGQDGWVWASPVYLY